MPSALFGFVCAYLVGSLTQVVRVPCGLFWFLAACLLLLIRVRVGHPYVAVWVGDLLIWCLAAYLGGVTMQRLPSRTQDAQAVTQVLLRQHALWRVDAHLAGPLQPTATGVLIPLHIERASAVDLPTARAPLIEFPSAPLLLVRHGGDPSLLPGDAVRFLLDRDAQRPAIDPLRAASSPEDEPPVWVVDTDALVRRDDRLSRASLSLRLWRRVARLQQQAAQRVDHGISSLPLSLGPGPAASPRLVTFLNRLTLGVHPPVLPDPAASSEAPQPRSVPPVLSPAPAPSVESVLRDAGIFHVLSVSGLHLTAVSLSLFHVLTWLLRRLFLWLPPSLGQRFVPKRISALLSLPGCLGYALLTGAEPPTVRAACSVALGLLAIAGGRRVQWPECVAVAVLLYVLPFVPGHSPLQLLQPSLLLSLVAVLAMLALRPCTSLLRAVLPHARHGAHPIAASLPSWQQRLGRFVLRSLDGSVAVFFATMPLLLTYFAELQPVGLLTNLLLVPWVELVLLPLNLLAIGLAGLWPPLAWPLWIVVAQGAAGFLAAAEWVARLHLTVQLAAPSGLAATLFGAGLGLCCLHRRAARLVLLGAIGLYWLQSYAPHPEVVVTFLDVGQGDAAIVELPSRKVVVLDAGWPPLASRAFPPQSVVTRLLHRRGHRRIDLLIASHLHPDHVGGLPALLSDVSLPVSMLWFLPISPALPLPDRESRPAWQAALVQAALAHGTQISAPTLWQADGLTLSPLAPCQQPPLSHTPCQPSRRTGFSENDNSLVLRVAFAGRAILFPGDIERRAEHALLSSTLLQQLRADVLKLPHHGSRTSTSRQLLDAVQPQVAVASLGRGNRFGFPHPETVASLASRAVPLFRTDRDHHIEVTLTAAGGLCVKTQQDARRHPVRTWLGWLPWAAPCAEHPPR